MYDRVYDEQHYRKLCACSVQRVLAEELRAKRVMTSLSTLLRYIEGGHDFIGRIVTGDKA
jgi:hypothetical protein